MRDVEVFFLFVFPLVIAFMGWLIVISTTSDHYDDSNKGPEMQDTFEEMNDE